MMKARPRPARDALRRWHADARLDEDLLPGFQEELALYFSGRPVSFCVPVDLASLTDFQRRVLRACSRIEYGRTITYGDLARDIGSPAAARAVGGALARNPVPLVIPCHRVVGCNGGLGGFSAEPGLRLKRFLLDLESRTSRTLECTDAKD